MSDSKRIEFMCLSCGWKKSLPASWNTTQPTKCGNKKCKTHFLINPEKLAVYDPQEVAHQRSIAGTVPDPDVQIPVELERKSKNRR